MSAKGIKLNNPFDIELSNIPWQGLVTPGSDPVFCEFVDAVHGLRAGFIDLKVKINEKLDTISKIITKFAPPSENDTESYIANVSAMTGIDKDAQLTQTNIQAVGLAIIHQEVGSCPYTDDEMVVRGCGIVLRLQVT